MKRRHLAVAVAVFALAASSFDADARRGGGGFVDDDGDGINDIAARRHAAGPRGFFGDSGGLAGQLTDEQEAALQAQIDELRASGATREEIHDALQATLTGFGVELPGYGDFVVAHVGSQLSDEQELEIQALVASLEADGADKDDVRAAVDEKLAEFGVEITMKPGDPVSRFAGRLTDAQESELQALVESLEAEGATRADVRTAVEGKLVEFGIDLPDYADAVVGRFGNQLTDAQEAELQALVDGLEADGAAGADIRTAVDEKLAEYGIEAPVGGPMAGPGGRRGPGHDGPGGPGGRGGRGPRR